ncbi:hypothetical protein FRUB_01626 [Fimbriiglobus ruber]|uniref:Uncharacterized protein n=1 Tax=Fimbriiglobus ruber TaxID=1908690 RepID=A0A225E9P2_9BACT|nr:hypothetical protein FRUB_01626 [Fimbriiglobus ruber]
MIRLVGLDKMPLNNPQAANLRWNDRREAWEKANRYLDKFQTGMVAIDAVVDLCKSDGHWSIWMTVFANIPDVCLALIGAIPGTAACFNTNGAPIQRPGGHI